MKLPIPRNKLFLIGLCALAIVLFLVAASISTLAGRQTLTVVRPAKDTKLISCGTTCPILQLGTSAHSSHSSKTLSWHHYPTKGSTHFYQAWRRHHNCGHPTSREQNYSTGYTQHFQHCTFHEAPVTIKFKGVAPHHTAVPPKVKTDAQYLLAEINAERVSKGYLPLQEDARADKCALNHSIHMGTVGFISHDQFPSDICATPYSTAGENVGEAGGYGVRDGIDAIQAGMIAEPWTPGCSNNHHCNELSSKFTTIGIGVYVSGNNVWITETFTG